MNKDNRLKNIKKDNLIDQINKKDNLIDQMNNLNNQINNLIY